MKLSELNRRRRRKNGSINVPYTCEIEYLDQFGERRIARGRTFEVEKGFTLDLFPMGVLCKMLNRHRRAIYRWEKERGFPPALWRVADDKVCNRWYSRKQLIAIRAIYDHYGKLQGKNRTNLNKFIAAVRAVFHTVDLENKSEEGQTEGGREVRSGETEMGSPAI